MGYHEFTIEGRNAVMEAFRSGVNYYDTAYIYPGSEAALGEVLELVADVDFSDIIRTAGNGLHGKLPDQHIAVNDLFQSRYSGIDRAVAGGNGFKVFT